MKSTCEICGQANARRRVNFNKPGGGTGRLRACDDCANAMKTVRAPDGVWTLHLDLDEPSRD
jgi:ribosome-binding protein aMBF1 (putative translation factor)